MLETRRDHGDKLGANPVVYVIMGGYVVVYLQLRLAISLPFFTTLSQPFFDGLCCNHDAMSVFLQNCIRLY